MTNVILNEREKRQIDSELFYKKSSRKDHISFILEGNIGGVQCINPIYACVGFLESDSSTMADMYICFVFQLVKFLQATHMITVQKRVM